MLILTRRVGETLMIGNDVTVLGVKGNQIRLGITRQRTSPSTVKIGAGLPQLVALAGRSKSYAERLFRFPEVGALQPSDAIAALQEPVQDHGVEFSAAALQEIIQQTKGYPYFLQERGYQAWNLAPSPHIGIGVVNQATDESIRRLDTNFFRVRFDRLTPRERQYLRTLADMGETVQRSGEIADRLGAKVRKYCAGAQWPDQKRHDLQPCPWGIPPLPFHCWRTL
jgi:hypothetical protein